MNRYKELIELIKENPDLEVIPMVDNEVIGGDEYSNYYGHFGKAYVEEYVYMLDFQNIITKDNTYEIQEYLENEDEMTDEEIQEYIKNLEWKKAIFVYIDVPELEG